MKRKIFSMILILAMLVSVIPCTHAATIIDSVTYTGLSWKLDSNGTLTISGEGKILYNRHYMAEPPWLKHNSKIKSIVLEEGITKIGGYEGLSPFKDCDNVKSVSIPSTLTYFSKYAFDCPNLDSVYITNLAAWCNIKYFSNYTTYGHYNTPEPAFSKPYNLYLNNKLVVNLTISGNIETIESGAFKYCKSLKTLNVQNGVKDIGIQAFAYCHSLSNITLSNGIIFVWDSFGGMQPININ